MNIITGELKNWRTLKGIQGLEDGLEFLEKANLAALSPGKHEILGEEVFATCSKSPSRAPETAQFEAHRKYIDIQYLISGSELIGVAPVGGLPEVTPYDPSKDIAFYSSPAQYQNIEMQPAVSSCSFQETPTCRSATSTASTKIHKVVIKVSMDHWKACKK